MTRISLVIGLLFSLAGIYLVTQGNAGGWIVLGFFGICSAIAAIPLLPKQWFSGASPDSFIGNLRGDVQIPDPELGVLVSDAEGLRHTSMDGKETFIGWEQIDRITTFKLDLLTTDCICLYFEGRFNASPYQINEEIAGFSQLFGPLRDAFPSISGTWYFDVMSPAFETKREIIYDRKEAANNSW